MRIGVVSDTHNHLRNTRRIVELFNAAGVEQVVHTGDITQPKVLHALRGLDAPLAGVFGNNDLERRELEATCSELDFHFRDPPLHLDWGGRRVVVVHDPRDLAALSLEPGTLALHGHTHCTTTRRHEDGGLAFNPGECAGMIAGANTVGVVDLFDLRVELLRF